MPEGLLAGNGLWKRLVRHDRVAVAAVIVVPADVAGRCQVGHDAVGASLGDAQAGPDVMQSHPGVVREKQQHTAVVTHEAPASCPKHYHDFWKQIAGIAIVGLKIQGAAADPSTAMKPSPLSPAITSPWHTRPDGTDTKCDLPVGVVQEA